MAPIKHGHALRQTPEYRAWKNMKSRCKPASERRRDYFDRGIAVCPEWSASFKSFLKHVGPRPTPEHCIDRINNDLGYFPGNVHWADPFESSKNRRKPAFKTPESYERMRSGLSLGNIYRWAATSPFHGSDWSCLVSWSERFLTRKNFPPLHSFQRE